MIEKKSIAIVMPVYEDCSAFQLLLAELSAANIGPAIIVAVDDGSINEPVPASLISEAGLDGVVLRLARNVGHQSAIAIGISYVAENLSVDHVVVMDSDGEDSPHVINELISQLKNDQVDVAVAQRRERQESLAFRVFYTFYKPIFRTLTGRQLGFGNFMAIKGRYIRRLASMSECWIHFAGSVLASKLRIERVPVDRASRYAGQSKMNFVGLALHGFRSMMVFSEDVLVRTGTFVAWLVAIVILAVGVAGGLKLAGFATPGWLTSVVGLSVIVVLQTGTLTLTTLLTAGVIKSVSLNTPDYRRFIEEIISTDADIAGDRIASAREIA